uniref:JAB1/MPN/MOV34 metalloenzyme domain-containing protein n=1 Tax=Oryza rufipogon TaxID=4529 RepID=A0A0E0RK81_ORYRU
MLPHEDALDAGAVDVLTFRLHPLAVLKLSHRIREFVHLHDDQYQQARMSGCVIGVRRGGTVDISDTFDILHDPDPGTFDRALLEKDQEIYKKAFPDLSVLGWYSIGTNVHATDTGIHHGDYTDMQIHQTLMDANGTAFYLLLNPAINFSHKDIPDIWLSFTDPHTAHQVVRTIGFIEVGDKSVVWDNDIGPGEDIEHFILKFPIKSLVVPDAQLKFIIEKNLNISCWFNGRIVPELIWGINYALDEFVPREKGNLSNERHFPLSKQLHEQLKAYGFSISPQLKFDRFFCGLEMSEGEFVRGVAHRLHSMECNTISRLKRMEAEDRGTGLGHPWVCAAAVAVGFGVMAGLCIAMKRAN